MGFIILPNTGEAEWKRIPGYEDYYEASIDGRIRSVDRENINATGIVRRLRGVELSPWKSPTGHLKVSLTVNGRGVSEWVHRLILLTFVGECPDGMECCHNEGNPKNNHVKNLRCDTPKSNRYDCVSHGNHHNANKIRCVHGHLFAGSNLKVTERGHRVCLSCRRANSRRSALKETVAWKERYADDLYKALEVE